MNIKNTVARLYNSALLLILPEVQTALVFVAKAVAFLEVREAALERHIEDRVVAIAQTSRQRRDALTAVQRHFAKVDLKNLTAIHQAQAEVRAAADARSAVENLLNRG